MLASGYRRPAPREAIGERYPLPAMGIQSQYRSKGKGMRSRAIVDDSRLSPCKKEAWVLTDAVAVSISYFANSIESF